MHGCDCDMTCHALLRAVVSEADPVCFTQGHFDAGGLLSCSCGSDAQRAATRPTLPGDPQQRRAVPAHGARLLPRQCLDQQLSGGLHELQPP